MKKSLRKALSAALLVVFLVSTALLLRQMKDSADGGDTYREVQQLAGIGQVPSQDAGPETTAAAPKPTEAEWTLPSATDPTVETEPRIHWVPAEPLEEDPWIAELSRIDLEELKQVNEDVIGWILIPGTEINYPILQGADNGYYLNHLWDGGENSAGSIFMECTDNGNFSDFHTILYGHNMIDGSMFSNLHYYQHQSYLPYNPYVYVVSESGVYRYGIYAAHRVETDNYIYALELEQEEQRKRLIEATLDQSALETEIVPAVTDRILTLSTCDVGQNVRWVVHARLEMVPQVQ